MVTAGCADPRCGAPGIAMELDNSPAHYRDRTSWSAADAEMGLDFPDYRRGRGHFWIYDVEAASATIAQWLFGIFLVLFLGALIVGLTIGAKLTS